MFESPEAAFQSKEGSFRKKRGISSQEAELLEMEEEIRIYGDPYEEYREEMLRRKGENC